MTSFGLVRASAVLLTVSFLVSIAPLTLFHSALAITWDPIEEISEDKRIEFQRYPAIAAEGGKAYAVWADNGDRDYDIMFRDNDGAAWQFEEELNTDDRDIDQFLPDVAVDSGIVHAVWHDPINGDYDIMYRRRSGGVWGPIDEASSDVGSEIQQNARVAASGNVAYIVWQDGAGADWDIYFRSYDGVSWGAVQEVNIDVGSEAQSLPAIAAGGGNVYVVWEDSGDGDKDIFMRVFNGVSWGSIMEVSQDTANQHQNEPDVAWGAGKVHIVWQEFRTTDRDIFYRSWDGSSFSSIQEISVDSGTEFQDVPAVAAQFGKVHVVWADRGGGDWDIVYRQFDGSSWLATQEVSIDSGVEDQWNPDIATEGGRVHVVWEDPGDGDNDIFYRRGYEAPPVDTEPPDILNVLLDGSTSQSYLLSVLPATLSLTATIDDSLRGNSLIGGANYTFGVQNWWTSTSMTPDDFLDSSIEGFHSTIAPPATEGSWEYCVYAWDIVPNNNVTGSCVSLTIADDLAPIVTGVLIDGLPIISIPLGTPFVFLTATLDDSTTGSSIIGGANYTSPAQDWGNSSVMIPDNTLNTPIESFHAAVDTSTLGLGAHDLCVYGWDSIPNHNTVGECASLVVSSDVQPPLVSDVLINGQPSVSYGISSVPVLTLTATVDDSTTGNSNIGGANYTIGIQNWPTSQPMTPNDLLDASTEGFHATLDSSSFGVGTYQICVYGWDDVPNHNSAGSCATLTIEDDMAPETINVFIDGMLVRTILEGTVSVQLTATVDDGSSGGSIIGGANYTVGAGAFPGTDMNPVNPPLDSTLEDFSYMVPTGGFVSGIYQLCVYGWDSVPNNNTLGSCATLIVALETQPPLVTNVLVNGMPIATYGVSFVPALTLTATIDDSTTGNSIIGGANHTRGLGNWPTSTSMTPDNALDSPVEGFHATLAAPGALGTWDYCVYGWDDIPNYNIVGSCATLSIYDDLPPDVTNVLIDGDTVKTITQGDASVTLTATVDDSSTGGSIVSGANYTTPAQDWLNATPMNPDDFLDSVTEGFNAVVDTSTLEEGMYDICVYGWDESLNNNTIGSCASLIVNPPGFVDYLPPEILNVVIDGQATQTYELPSLPSTITITATLDDSFTGGSLIASANVTLGPQNWQGTPMNASDSSWDEVIEDVELALVPPSEIGTYVYCVYGSDTSFEHNTTGDCASLTIAPGPAIDNPPSIDDLTVQPPVVEQGETVEVVLIASDDGSITEVRVDVVGPDGPLFNGTIPYDGSRGAYVVHFTYDTPGDYDVTVWVQDDGGNWATQGSGFEITESAVSEPPEENFKPALAASFAIILLIIGLISMRLKNEENIIRRFWFLIFLVAEAITGTISAVIGALSIPPILGAGLAVDILILLIGLSLPLNIIVSKLIHPEENLEEVQDEMPEGTDPENTK